MVSTNISNCSSDPTLPGWPDPGITRRKSYVFVIILRDCLYDDVPGVYQPLARENGAPLFVL